MDSNEIEAEKRIQIYITSMAKVQVLLMRSDVQRSLDSWQILKPAWIPLLDIPYVTRYGNFCL